MEWDAFYSILSKVAIGEEENAVFNRLEKENAMRPLVSGEEKKENEILMAVFGPTSLAIDVDRET